ncbi:MAG: hypothetical protein ACUZ9M_02565 [Candidatus Scalindua sp.]
MEKFTFMLRWGYRSIVNVINVGSNTSIATFQLVPVTLGDFVFNVATKNGNYPETRRAISPYKRILSTTA